MAEITAAMVRDLRDRTDAPMMECKKALSEASGDIAKAEELLRIKLGNKASKAASRLAAEGIIGIHVSPDGTSAAMVEINCETDFVAKNDDFVAFAKTVAETVASRKPADTDVLSKIEVGGKTLDEIRKTLVGKIGENLSVRRFVVLEAKGRISQYVHGAKIGVLVDVVGGDPLLGKDIAMQIAAAKPVALSKEQIPAEVLQKERDIAKAKAVESGKPANIAEKMVEGAVQKFVKEVTLLGQPFVKDDKMTIEALLKSKSASVAGFSLFVVGEGIQKKVTDFAEEVKAQAAQALRS
jgi:elongation factor Ts